MFALRASGSSRWASVARKPLLASRLLSTRAQDLGDFLEEPEINASTEPARFHVATEEPPTAESGSFPPKYRLHCHSSRNNTIVTFTKPDGATIAWASGGSCGFKKSNRAGYEAGYQCAKTMFQEILKEKNTVDLSLELFFKGFGEGREAMKTAILGAEGELIRPIVTRITDRTPIKIGGTRSKKTRRV
ncbi:translational machinery component [Pholiota conissans]|uniref:Translational machinery component n=1 Tax=Pholiota conissans TaxID=109636 RepID=A0A9P5ZC84_9AGAR|nr:translational machinery component [Pholiota conissans]